MGSGSHPNVDIYDLAVEAGSLARQRGVDKTQVANIISTFEGIPDVEEACKHTILFIGRQVGRGEIDRVVGRTLIKHINLIMGRYRGELGENVRKYLYLFKWVFESDVRRPLKTFGDYIKSWVS